MISWALFDTIQRIKRCSLCLRPVSTEIKANRMLGPSKMLRQDSLYNDEDIMIDDGHQTTPTSTYSVCG